MHKQIEDIIESRNKSGLYDIPSSCGGVRVGQQTGNQPANLRYAYSTPGSSLMEDIRDNVSNRNVEGNSDLRYLDCGSGNNSIGPTDSEITLCRVKRENSNVKKRKVNNWDVMHDLAIPGDGTHLGESPSLVNLVTFVVSREPTQTLNGKSLEYLVPLSSWEPTATSEHSTAAPSKGRSEEHTAKVEKITLLTATPHTPTSNAKQALNSTQKSLNSLQSTKSVEKQKSTSSMKDLFRRIAFWKRKSRENVELSAKPLEAKGGSKSSKGN